LEEANPGLVQELLNYVVIQEEKDNLPSLRGAAEVLLVSFKFTLFHEIFHETCVNFMKF
jgi:hypothetical protein